MHIKNNKIAPNDLHCYFSYFPYENPLPVPLAYCPPKRPPLEACPDPDPLPNPPLYALEMPTPLADTPPKPALPVPNPAPLPPGPSI
jgi:hypothetical protein